MPLRVLFVTPPYACWGVQVIGTWPPLHLVYLAGAALEAGHEARIYDAMNKKHTFEDVRAELERWKPDVVMALDYLPVTGAISTATVPAALEVLRLAKAANPKVATVIGGPHPSFMFQELLGAADCPADYVIRGEPEETLQALLGALGGGDVSQVKGLVRRSEGKVVVHPTRPQIADLDALKPAWHLLEWDDYQYNIEPGGRMASVLASRGCMMGCSFCSQRLYWRGEWRPRDAAAVVAEMRHLVETYQIKFITLIDAYPTRDRARWEHLLDLLIEARLGASLLIETRVEDIIRDADILGKYRAAGIIHIYVGAESSSDAMLDSLNKGTDVNMNARALALLREADIMSEASFMIGFPNETWESIGKTAQEAVRLNPDIAVFPVVTPMPFTPLYREMKDRIRVFDYSQYNLVTPIIEPYAMSLAEVTRALGHCYMTFYSKKAHEVHAMPDSFKRRYMLSAFKQMMKDYGERFDFAAAGHHHMHHLHAVR